MIVLGASDLQNSLVFETNLPFWYNQIICQKNYGRCTNLSDVNVDENMVLDNEA